MNPITREEYFLAKIAGEESPEIQPVTREEIFLAKAAGMDVPELKPVTRKEWFISQIAGGGGGGGGGGGDAPFSFNLLHTEDLGFVETTSTAGVVVKEIYIPQTENVAQAYAVIVEGDQVTGFGKSMAIFGINGGVSSRNFVPFLKRKSDDRYLCSAYGVYLSAVAVDSTNRKMWLTFSAKYSSTASETISGNYTAKIYAIGY